MSLVYKNGKYKLVPDVDVEPITYTANDYACLVSEKIRERYSIDEEFAIQRQRDTKIQEFEEYNSYCEECKQQAKILCGVTNG